MTAYRLAQESRLVDFESPISFRFDGKAYSGFRGDTLASALLANGVHLVGRSFKYHRPRGIMGIGPEEPNALVEVGEGAWREPNTRATQIALYDGLVARSQNRWPSLAHDALRINDVFSPVLKAGFYYKTFKWPQSWWPSYEHYIRKVAGLGSPPHDRDPAQYETRWHHTDIVVVGAGAAGLAAARAASQCGARVTLIEQEPHPGGFLRHEQFRIDGLRADVWARGVGEEIRASPNGSFIANATALGIYDHNFLAVVERLSPPGRDPGDRISQRLWNIRARHIILATGAIERPLVLPGNDLPGVMLATAGRGYVNAFSVAPGKRAVVMTNNSDAFRTATGLTAAGLDVCAIVDTRPQTSGAAGLTVRHQHALSRILGGDRVRAVEIRPLSGGPSTRIDCDLVCLSGGYTPSVHLYMHARGALRWSEDIAAFVPARELRNVHVVGGCAGSFSLPQILAHATETGIAIAESCGVPRKRVAPPVTEDGDAYRIEPFWQLPLSWPRRGKAFVDLQNDVTEADIGQARDEGYVSLEHLKRYTTLGMGTDQGKTSNVNGLALMSVADGRSVGATGTTTFRPPYSPVTLGALTGGHTGVDVVPLRQTPLAEILAQEGAVFVNSGLWRRARYFPRSGETLETAARREAHAVRHDVGMTEVSTLGKIEVLGPGAVDLLDRVYATPVRSLSVGRARWGVMLREDGMVFDDGTLWRLADESYLVTASTANASAVLSHLEYVRDAVMPDLDVDIACVSEQWAGVALAGPKSPSVMNELLVALGVALGAGLAPLEIHQFETREMTLRVARISFSGEKTFEIYVPARKVGQLWQALRVAGNAHNIVPYGLESLEYLRIEKGFLSSGHEINGRTTPDDLGVQRMLKKRDTFLGAAGLRRPALQQAGRQQLVGLVAIDGEISEGAQLQPMSGAVREPSGYVTSAGYSVHLKTNIALALLANGRARHGETLIVADPIRSRSGRAKVASPVFYDPEGAALVD